MTMMSLTNIARSPGDPKVVRSGPSSMSGTDRLARALGWFSIGLGVAELVAPERITKALGMEGKETLVRAYGVREIGAGMMCLSADKHAGLWSRVAGDGLDIMTLMGGLRDDNPKRDNVAIALAMVGGVTLLDLIAAQGQAVRHSESQGQRRTYYDRSGFPQGIEASRGLARQNKNGRDARSTPALAAVSG